MSGQTNFSLQSAVKGWGYLKGKPIITVGAELEWQIDNSVGPFIDLDKGGLDGQGQRQVETMKEKKYNINKADGFTFDSAVISSKRKTPDITTFVKNNTTVCHLLKGVIY